MQFIDLSFEMESTVSEPQSPHIDYVSHKEGAELLGKSLGLVAADFPDQMGLSLERISLTSHSGTHLDAPLHYGPLCENKQAKNISEIPLEWCFQRGIALDCSENQDIPITKEEVIESLDKKQIQLKPLNIVLFYTGADKLWGTSEYFTSFRGVSPEATLWLIEQQIKIICVDSFGFDPPFHKMLQKYKLTGDSAYLWPAHVLGRKREYCQIEKLRNVDSLLNKDSFMLHCFPIKIKNAGAGWVRVVAMLNSTV